MHFDVDNPPKCADCMYCNICSTKAEIEEFSLDNNALLCVAFLWCAPSKLTTKEMLKRLSAQIYSREAHGDAIGASELTMLYDRIEQLQRRADDGKTD